MLLDTITNQWFWLAAAGSFIILLGVIRVIIRTHPRAQMTTEDQEGGG